MLFRSYISLFRSYISYIMSSMALIGIVFFISGCVAEVDYTKFEEESCGFKKELVQGGDFLLTTYQKITDESSPYVFYIEGDGRAYFGKSRISNDPTPRSSIFIDLAAMDTRPNVVYIARPCQFTPRDLNPQCDRLYWTTKRYSEEVVDSINQAINKLNAHSRPFSLLGYSGGGAIAILIAERNSLVKDIVTVAGNLDIEQFVKYHKVGSIKYSLNPVDYATKVRHIPQLHFVGGKDTRVPKLVSDSFLEVSDSKCVKQYVFPNAEHSKGWSVVWNEALSMPVTCD